MFRDNVSVQSSRVKKTSWPLKTIATAFCLNPDDQNLSVYLSTNYSFWLFKSEVKKLFVRVDCREMRVMWAMHVLQLTESSSSARICYRSV
jgi:hypothetical protein